MQAVTRTLADPVFKRTVDALPGYDAAHSGRVTPWRVAFANA